MFDFVDGPLVVEVKLKCFSAGIDEGDLCFGVRRLLYQFGHHFSDATCVAVSNKKDFFWRFS
jgi:hypothetical protein